MSTHAAQPHQAPLTAHSHPDPSVTSQRPLSASYFTYAHPHQQQQQQQQQSYQLVDDETLSNTLANTHFSAPDDNLHLPNRQPKFNEEWDASIRGSSILDGPASNSQFAQQRQRSQSPNMQRSNSVSSRTEVVTGDGASAHSISLSRGNTLKKKNSLKRGSSLKRSSSRRSMKAGSVRSLALHSTHETDELHSAFYCPIPTSGTPTEVLANRFQAWRKILKDLIAYFREIQNHYEHRSKSLIKLANVCNNISTPPGFITSGGLDDALQVLRDYHKRSILEATKAKEIEDDVVLALTGLRSDLNQKMKEIKSLSGDFKNSVDKEMDNTRRAVKALQEVLGHNELDPSTTTGKQDPYLLRLAVDRQVERQLDEENYLHQAYLNLETSGRELESIIVGEIQKSYNAYAGILKREADAGYGTVEELRQGPIAMPKDHEWISFIQRDSQFVDPDIPMRTAEQIHYPGRDHLACQEIRAGLLERKSKYLKSYTAGWYVLSPTHLHEFKSADKTQAPIMSLYLPEQKLGSHSTEGGSSNKFILKGRQTGTMHRGHTWVFRAESHDTMMAWYEDIKALTEKSPEELNNFVRGHARTYSRSSQRSISSDGMVDEEDEVPFTVDPAVSAPSSRHDSFQNRPSPGGRFPSDLQVNAERGLHVPLSPTSSASGNIEQEGLTRTVTGNSGYADHDAIAAAGALPGSGVGQHYLGDQSSMVGPSYAMPLPSIWRPDKTVSIHDNGEPVQPQTFNSAYPTNAPIVVAGPVSVATTAPGTPATELTTLSDDTGLSSSVADGYTNGGFKPPPSGMNGAAYVAQNQMRPTGGRNNSTPHVPGEYPRSTPGATPGV
ncbi:hypothetical protein GGR57DRAFT_504257 [Xylariaceae sp. FL1272]|nr:hypothetical protein GGR57DRAFT_504257 [Xylariaceae sp. FL1272]